MSDWPKFSDIRDWVVLLIALYGAVLSSFNFWQARRKENRILKMSISTMIATFSSGDLGESFAKIEAVNFGQRTITVTNLALELPSKQRLFSRKGSSIVGMPDTPLPIALADGHIAYLLIPYKDIASSLLNHGIKKTTLKPLAIASTGEIYRGEPWKFDSREWQS